MVLCAGFSIGASNAAASTFYATNSDFGAVFAAAAAGDKIILSGSFAAISLSDRDWAVPVQIDATAARFTDSLSIKNVSGLVFTGGQYGSTTAGMRLGRAIVIYGGDTITFNNPIVDGNRAGVGIAFTGTSNITVNNGVFSSLKVGLTLTGVTGGSLTGNQSLAAASDGMNIVDSHFVTASGNMCSGTVISAGAHPDCIQMWSLAGNPVQSDISLIDNIATGATQGFTSFDAKRGGGLRIIMRGNRVDTSYPQGIACYGCVDSSFTDNVLTTLAGSPYRTSINIVGGSNNIIANNSVGARPLADGEVEPDFDATLVTGFESNAAAGRFGGNADAVSFANVPEPGVWAQLIIGLGGVGLMLRGRRRVA